MSDVADKSAVPLDAHPPPTASIDASPVAVAAPARPASPTPLWTKQSKGAPHSPTSQAASGSTPAASPPSTTLSHPTMTAVEHKDAGNAYMAMRAYGKAATAYSAGIVLDPKNAILRTNRAAARYNLGLYLDSLADAEAAIAADPQWWKAYKRKALSLFSLERFDDALATLETAIAKFPEQEDDLKESLATLNKLLERISMLYTFPGPALMSKLDTVPVFLVADAQGQPFFITYEDGQQICSFYFEYSEAEATLDWIKSETPEVARNAHIAPLALSQALKLTQETNQAILKEEEAARQLEETGQSTKVDDQALTLEEPTKEADSVKEDAPVAKVEDSGANADATPGEADAPAANAEDAGPPTPSLKEQPLMFNFRADNSALKDAVELLKNPPPKPESNEEEGQVAEVPQSGPRNKTKAEDVLPPVDYKNLTVENFNGIPIFQAKGLTLLQKEEQFIPLFFTKPDLLDAWQMLKTNGSFGVEDAPEECEIDIGTLEDVLRRMAESEKTGDFKNVVFVAIKEARKMAGPHFPVDEVTKSALDAPSKKPRNHKFQAAVKIKAQGGSKDAIRDAIRKQLAAAAVADKQFEEVAQRHKLDVSQGGTADSSTAKEASAPVNEAEAN